MTFEDVCAIGLGYPGVVRHITHGTPSLKVGTAFLLREREPGIIVLRRPDMDERDFLLEVAPDVFFITDHYRGYPYVLARLDKIDTERFRHLFEPAWRSRALKKHIAAFEGQSS